MQAVIQRDIPQRISAADAMHHPWFRSFGIGKPQQPSLELSYLIVCRSSPSFRL
jgi:hypothetical protein